MIVHKHKRVDSAPFNYGRQNAQHIAAASIHSYFKYIQNSGKLQWGYGFFDSRLREGGDRSRSSRSSTTKRFNPRLREGGDDFTITKFAYYKEVSIHASAREATTRPSCARFPSKRFNPRLREGGDQKGRQEKPYERGFNPRLREGGDIFSSRNIPKVKGFQSTPPRGRRLSWASSLITSPRFQSTPPRGRRQESVTYKSDREGFNPRLREGGDAIR